MRVGTAAFDDGEVLVTVYDNGETTVARRDKAWDAWGAPASVAFEPEYDYKADRHIEDVLSSTGLLFGERDA